MLFNIDGEEINIDKDKIKLKELAEMVEENYQGHICLGLIENKLYDLNRTVYRGGDISFLDTTTPDGNRLYFRGLSLLLLLACRDLYPEKRVLVRHSIGDGLYCVLEGKRGLSEVEIDAIKEKMLWYSKKNAEIICRYVTNDQAIDKFEDMGRFEKAGILKYRKDDLTKIYECCGLFDYFYGYMFPSTGYLKDLDLAKMADGMVILGPKEGVRDTVTEFKEMPKLSEVYRESEKWSETLGIDTVVDLNRVIENDKYGEMIRTVQALHEKKIAKIADMIEERKARVILIGAPSSSGKTSFAHRLSIQLRVNGLNPVPISLDNYFVERSKTPRDENGKMDFESIKSIDVEKFNEDIVALLNGESVPEIKFDFIYGKRKLTGRSLRLKPNQPIILEGIHGLNPILTEHIEDKYKFKIYLSAITQVNLDDHNRIPTTDLRLLRRMVRDDQFRGMSAEKTIETWPSVRRGEEKNIFPFQEEADVMFNSVGVYELSVLKPKAEKILKKVDEDSEYYLEANRLRKILQYFVEITDLKDIGPTAIIREFIGGSTIVHQ